MDQHQESVWQAHMHSQEKEIEKLQASIRVIREYWLPGMKCFLATTWQDAKRINDALGIEFNDDE